MIDYSFIDQQMLKKAIADMEREEEHTKKQLKDIRGQLKVLRSFVKKENNDAV